MLPTSLGSHVFQEGNSLINLTTKVRLPLDANIKDLKNNNFLIGQEAAAIRQRLFDNPISKTQILNFKIISTWMCNLRCTHCFVLNKLKSEHIANIDPQALSNFINKIADKAPELKSVGITFLGGEPLLNYKLCTKIIEAMPNDRLEFNFGITTNGTILNDEIIELLKKLTHITISVDGPEFIHNAQRKPLDDINPFETVRRNIKILVKHGMRDKILTQASIPGEQWNKENIRKYIKEMLKIGIKYENIRYGTIVPTHQKPIPHARFLESIKSRILPSPCCKYRFGHDFVVDDNNAIYCDYFEDSDKSKVGTLYDNVDTIESNMQSLIENSIPALKDPVCTKCPVVGVCWGWCCNIHNRFKPSEICDKEGLQQIVEAATKEGNLEHYFFKENAIVIQELKRRIGQSAAHGGIGGSTPPPAGNEPSS